MKRFKARSIVLLLLFFALVVSGNAHAAYKETPVTDGGNVKGKVTFKGALPADAVERVAISKDSATCGSGYREIVWIDVKDKALRGAFVFVEGVSEGKPWHKPEGGKYILDQKGCRFAPWMQIVSPGDIVLRNSDPNTLHNVNIREMVNVESGNPVKRTLINIAQPNPGDIVKELKSKRSPFISVTCNAHNFMYAFMLALEHPYAAIVDDNGSFTIADLPPGTYTVKAWHPMLGLKEGKVTVSAKKAAEINFEFSAK